MAKATDEKPKADDTAETVKPAEQQKSAKPAEQSLEERVARCERALGIVPQE